MIKYPIIINKNHMSRKENFLVIDRFPDHVGYKFVDWDGYRIGKGKDLIGTDSVTSCLAITIFNPQLHRGVLAHITGLKSAPENLMPERVIDTLLHALHVVDLSRFDHWEATLAGEGSIAAESDRKSPIVRVKLKEFGIRIIGEDLCPAPGRLVFFTLRYWCSRSL